MWKCGFVSVILVVLLAICQGQKIVDTIYGQVQGHTLDVYNGETTSTVDIFYGVPFAQSTSGHNRFSNPVPPEPWTEVFVADTIRECCPQNEGGTLAITHPGWNKIGEDCLNVNIYSPDVSGGPFAVMVYLYGGGFNDGANFQYPGHFLATHGVVVVTANYRVNKFGFATTATEACPGNAGLYDQTAAIQFVRDNIANFGGDPTRITVFGESAGAASASLQMLSPVSKDLFHQAIMESGSETCPWVMDFPEEEPEEDFYRAAASMGCPTSSDEAMMECMRNFTWQEIFEDAPGFGGSPTIDGPGGFLPMSPAELRERGDIMKGPIISGINHDEGSLYLPGLVPGSLFGCCTRHHYKHIVENRLVGLIGGFLPNVTQQNIVEAMMHVYSPWPNIYDEWSNKNELVEMNTDITFGIGWNNQVTSHQQYGPTYAYVYNYRGRNSSQLIPEWMGVPHIAEIPYVWGYPLLPMNPEVEEDSEIEFDLIHWTDEDVRHTIFAMKLWTNFAKTGNPTPSPVENPLNTTTIWPQFTHQEMNVLVISNTTIETEVGWRQPEYYFWSDYLPYLVGTTGVDEPVSLYNLATNIMSSWASKLLSGYFLSEDNEL